MNDWDKILKDFAYKCGNGGPDMTNPRHLALLRESLLKFGWKENAMNEFLGNLRTLQVLREPLVEAGGKIPAGHTDANTPQFWVMSADGKKIGKLTKLTKKFPMWATQDHIDKNNKKELERKKHEKWQKNRKKTIKIGKAAQSEIRKAVMAIVKKGDGPSGIMGGPSAGLANEAVSVDNIRVKKAEKKLKKDGIITATDTDGQLKELTEKFDEAVDSVAEGLMNDKKFLNDPLIAKSVVSRNKLKKGEKVGSLTSISKKKIRNIAGSIVGNRKLQLEGEQANGWDTNKTDTNRFIGSDNQLQLAADQVDDFVTRRGKAAVLVTKGGEKHPFFKENGDPNTIKYVDKDGTWTEDTVQNVVKYQIINSGAGLNAGDTIALAENSGSEDEILFDNISNKTEVGDHIAHSTPETELVTKKEEVNTLVKNKVISEDEGEAAQKILNIAEKSKKRANNNLYFVTQTGSKEFKRQLDPTTTDQKTADYRKKQLAYAWENDVIGNDEYDDETGWPDPKKEEHWREPVPTEGKVTTGGSVNKDSGKKTSNKKEGIMKKFGSFENFLDVMQDQEKMRKGEGPTKNEVTVMNRMMGRFKHWNKKLGDTAREVEIQRNRWRKADNKQHRELNKIRTPHKIQMEDGTVFSIQNGVGLGDRLLAEEVMGATHYHMADNHFDDKLLKQTSTTNNGGTMVDGETLKGCLGIDNKTQFLGGFRRGKPKLQRDTDKNVTGTIIIEYAIVYQVNPNFIDKKQTPNEPPMLKSEKKIAEKRYRTLTGPTGQFDTVHKWGDDVAECFEEKS